jgi:hypothetical protein
MMIRSSPPPRGVRSLVRFGSDHRTSEIGEGAPLWARRIVCRKQDNSLQVIREIVCRLAGEVPVISQEIASFPETSRRNRVPEFVPTIGYIVIYPAHQLLMSLIYLQYVQQLTGGARLYFRRVPDLCKIRTHAGRRINNLRRRSGTNSGTNPDFLQTILLSLLPQIRRSTVATSVFPAISNPVRSTPIESNTCNFLCYSTTP